jgi:hypothetical protein
MRKAILAVSFGLLCLLLAMWGCERHTTGVGGIGAGTVADVSITAGDTILATPAGVIDSTTITVIVTDAGGNGVPGEEVDLWMETNVGVLTSLGEDDTTDFGGQVTTVFRVNQHFGSNVIHARVGGATTSLRITVEEVNISQITLQVSPGILNVAPGASGQASLSIWVKDDMGNGVAHVKPSLRSSIGIIENYDRTDGSGKLTTNFYSAGDYGEAVITAWVGSISDTASIEVNPTAALTGTIQLSTDLKVIYADNQVTSAHVTALLKDADYQVIQHDTVLFSSNPGAIMSPAVTDSLGIAHTVFTDNQIATEPDSAIIIGRYPPFGIADTIYIMILEQQPIDHIALSVNPNSLTAGVDSAEVTATVLQLNGEFAPEGTEVIFQSTGGGSFEPSNVGDLNENGQATVYYYAPNATGTTIITATASGVVSDSAEVNIVPGPVRKLDISVEPSVLNLRETALVTVDVMDSLDNGVEDGVFVSFSTTLGTITPFAQTVNGQAHANLQSGTQAGLASVKAWVNIYSDSTTVEFYSGGPSTISLTSSDTSIQVANTGGDEQAILTARILDANGNIVEDGWPAYFSIENGGAPGGGININNHGIEDSAFTINGEASVTLNAGTASGPVLILAETFTDSAHTVRIFALKSNINVVSGPPDTINVGHNNIGEDGGAGTWIIDIDAAVGDIYNNPVNSWNVSFTVIPDIATIESENVLTGSQPPHGGDPVPGVAFTRLAYNGMYTNDSVTVRAACAVSGGNIYGMERFPLPLQDCTVTLYIQPEAWHFVELGDPAWLECCAVVQDGHGQLINNQLVLFFTTKGRFVAAQGSTQYIMEKLTGQPPDGPGEACLWIRAEEQYVFPDPITPEVTGTVHCSVYGYSECITDGQQIIFQR